MEKNKIFDISILFENEDCLFINKPAGISVHGDGKTPEHTVADWVLEKYPALASVGERMKLKIKNEELIIKKPGIVHRLDKETSGVMLIAKTHDAYEFFKKQFQERTTKKIYHAFVYGWLKSDAGTIDESIGRSTGDIRKWGTGKGTRGTMREATTLYRVLSRFSPISNLQSQISDGKGSTEEGTYSFVEAEPKTGRTHQIRVHLRSINHPIVCDSLYAPKRPRALGFERLALHARELTITLPSGEKKTVQAEYPPDFESATKKLT